MLYKKDEEKLKEIGIKDPQRLIRYEMLENNLENNKQEYDYSSLVSFNFVMGILLGILIPLMFVYVEI
jgi:uncharacterized membrane protein YciS (DUF1049 family)